MQPQPIDTLYQSYGRGLYKITGQEETDSIMDILQASPSSDLSSSVTVPADSVASGVSTSSTNQASGAASMQGKSTFDNSVEGYILGTDPSTGNAKFYIGDTTSYLNWNGDTGVLTVKGSISASSINIPDTTTASSFHVDSSGNTWWGATTLAASTASVTAAGLATFAGLSVINKKAFTNFEASGRFVSSTGGTGTNTFGNQGVTISPGATATSFSILQWRISNVYTNNPTFTATILALTLNAASGASRNFIGMGQPSISGSGITYSTHSMIGIAINKDSGVVQVSSIMNDGGTNTSVSNNITTLVDTDVLEIFIKVSATQVLWYYRKNGGTLTLGDTQTTHIPAAGGEDSIDFATSNIGTAVDCKLIVQSAGYEH